MILATPTERRHGFTLVEVLVVIAIIGILASLTLSGAFRARDGQTKANTEINIQKIASALDQQMKAIIDNANVDFNNNKGTAVSEITKFAGNDTRRAKALWIKVVVRGELPQSVAELSNSFGLPIPSVFNPLKGQVFSGEANRLNQIISGNGLPNWTSADIEAAATLYLTITSARRGVTVDIEQGIGSSGIGTVTSDAPSNKPHKVFVDSWGSPMKLIRVLPTSLSGVQTELDSAKYAGKTNGTTIKSIDPTDKEGTLSASWTPVPSSITNTQSFWGYLYPSRTSYTAHNYQPMIVSAGQDQAFGTDDDIYSFRLREVGQRGD